MKYESCTLKTTQVIVPEQKYWQSSVVTLTFDLLTPKCIGIFLSPSCIYVWNIKAARWKLLTLSCQNQSVDTQTNLIPIGLSSSGRALIREEGWGLNNYWCGIPAPEASWHSYGRGLYTILHIPVVHSSVIWRPNQTVDVPAWHGYSWCGSRAPGSVPVEPRGSSGLSILLGISERQGQKLFSLDQ